MFAPSHRAACNKAWRSGTHHRSWIASTRTIPTSRAHYASKNLAVVQARLSATLLIAIPYINGVVLFLGTSVLAKSEDAVRPYMVRRRIFMSSFCGNICRAPGGIRLLRFGHGYQDLNGDDPGIVADDLQVITRNDDFLLRRPSSSIRNQLNDHASRRPSRLHIFFRERQRQRQLSDCQGWSSGWQNQGLCSELPGLPGVSRVRNQTAAEEPARAVLRSCATLRTVSQDSFELNSARSGDCSRPPGSGLLSRGATSAFGDSEGRSLPARSRTHSEHEKVSRALFDLDCDPLAARVAHLEQSLTREEPLLQRFHSELRANFAAELEAVRAQLLEEFREQVQVQKQQAMAELQIAKEALRERFTSLPSHRSSERFRICWEEASRGAAQGDLALERLEALSAEVRRLTSEVRAQAELLDHVRLLTDNLEPTADDPRFMFIFTRIRRRT
eukprot:s5631_g1.t2